MYLLVYMYLDMHTYMYINTHTFIKHVYNIICTLTIHMVICAYTDMQTHRNIQVDIHLHRCIQTHIHTNT